MNGDIWGEDRSLALTVFCRNCGDVIPETMPIARERGHCAKATCIPPSKPALPSWVDGSSVVASRYRAGFCVDCGEHPPSPAGEPAATNATPYTYGSSRGSSEDAAAQCAGRATGARGAHDDDHADQLAADEADECIGSWQAIAKKLAHVTAALHTESPGSDGVIRQPRLWSRAHSTRPTHDCRSDSTHRPNDRGRRAIAVAWRAPGGSRFVPELTPKPQNPR